MTTCPKGKVPYSTLEDAKAACGSLALKNYRARQKAKRLTGEKPKRVKVRPYICPDCGWWHVGRGPQGADADWNRRRVRLTQPEAQTEP